MPLTLVLGPANSAKAGEVLGAYVAAAARGALLVVPTALDAEHYARELSGGGALLGSVLTFGGLAGEIARRTGFSAGRLTVLQRERLLGRAVRAAGLRRPGRGRALAGVHSGRGSPHRRAPALARGAGPVRAGAARPGRGTTATAPRTAREVAAIYAAYRRELERRTSSTASCSPGAPSTRCAACPRGGAPAPVFFYGFDDLHGLQRDAIETLSARSRGRGHRVAHLRARAQRLVRARRGGRGVAAAGAAVRRDAGPRRALRARGAARPFTISSAACSSPAASVRTRTGRRPARGRRRARGGRAAGRRGPRPAAARGWPAEEIAVVLRTPRQGAGGAGRRL